MMTTITTLIVRYGGRKGNEFLMAHDANYFNALGETRDDVCSGMSRSDIFVVY